MEHMWEQRNDIWPIRAKLQDLIFRGYVLVAVCA